tara:strand:- start:8848 stop:10608 length:1761 start_codon:yes stop_codon:yes gene_type:complete
MKIPTYRAKVQRSAEIAAQPLNVQANSGAFEAVGQATAKSSQFFNAAADWAVTEQKLQNATEVAKGERAYQTKLEEIQTDLEKNPRFNSKPEIINNAFNRRAKSARTKIAGTVVGTQAKKTFTANSFAAADTLRLKIKQTARVRLTAETITEQLTEAEVIRQNLGNLDPVRDQLAYQQNLNKLFGNEKKGVKGIYQNLVDLGHLNAKQAFEYEKNDRNIIDNLQVDKRLLNANQMSLEKEDIKNGAAAKAARQVLLDLQSGKIGKNLNVQTRQDAMERTNNLINQLENARIREVARRDASANKRKTANQKINFGVFLNRIIAKQLNPNDQTRTKPSIAEINKALLLQKITPANAEKLIASLNDQDALVTDKKFFGEILKGIREADNKTEIDALVKKAYDNYGPTSKTPLDQGQIDRIVQTAEQFVKQTPRAKAAKKYGDLLDALVQAEGVLDKIMGGASKRAALVLFNFEAKITETSIDPKIAFEQAIEEFGVTSKVNLNMIPKLQFLPAFEADAQSLGMGKSLSEWTVEDVEESRQLTLKNYKGKPMLLGTELFKLKMLGKYIETKNPAVKAAQERAAKDLEKAN